jgi:hypothetical protein
VLLIHPFVAFVAGKIACFFFGTYVLVKSPSTPGFSTAVFLSSVRLYRNQCHKDDIAYVTLSEDWKPLLGTL